MWATLNETAESAIQVARMTNELVLLIPFVAVFFFVSETFHHYTLGAFYSEFLQQ